MPGPGTNKPATTTWNQGFIISDDGVVGFVKKATRDWVMAEARAAGFSVEPTTHAGGYGFRETPHA